MRAASTRRRADVRNALTATLLAVVVGCADDAATPAKVVPPVDSPSNTGAGRGGAAGAGDRVSGAGTDAGGAAGQPSGQAGASGAATGGQAGKTGTAGTGGAAGAAGQSGGGSGGTSGSAGSAGQPTGAGGSSGTAGQGGAGGGGGSGGNGPDCTRKAATRTASRSLLTTLEAALVTASSTTEKDKLIDGFLADVRAGGGTPLVDEATDDVSFVIRGAPFQGTFHVAGSFNGWSENAAPMVALAGTDLYVTSVQIARNTAHAYKLVDVPDGGAGVYFEDRLARHVAWDGIDHHDVGELNALVRAEAADAQKGRLEAYRDVASAKLGSTRDVFVYVPPSYDDASCPTLPVLVVHDGNESITRAPFHLAADTHFVAHPNDAAVLVFVALHAQTERIDTYTFATPTGRADAYGDSLRDEILPWAASSHRLCPAPRDRGLTGASLGGLVSTYLGLRDPGTWGYVGAQSPSYWWENQAIFPIATATPVAATRLYVDNGCSADGVDQDGCDDAAAFVKLLDDKGWDVTHVVETGGQHDWTYWRDRWPQMLSRFREGRIGCELALVDSIDARFRDSCDPARPRNHRGKRNERRMGMGFAFDAAEAVLVAVRDHTNHDDDHATFLDHMQRLDRAAVSAGKKPVAILLTDRETPAPSAAWRGRFAESAKRGASKDTLFCLVTSSALQRGVLTAMQWLVPTANERSRRACATFEDAVRLAVDHRGLVPAFYENLRSRALADQKSRDGAVLAG